MSTTSDSFSGKLDGHEIRVEARTGPLFGRFALKVDGETQDMTKAIVGAHFLDGELPDGKHFQVKVVMKKAGLSGQEYWLLADGEERKLGEGWIW